MNSDAYEKYAALLLKNGELQQLNEFLALANCQNKKLVILNNLIKVFEEEAKNNLSFTVFDYSLDLDELVKHYITTKLLIRRFDFDLPKEYLQDFYYYCEDAHISEYFIANILSKNIFYPSKVIEKLNR